MATALNPAAKTLFNDPTLSDVKIKQIYNGETREYYGHKAILCFQSGYFMKAFTGHFKEASEPVMELHDDDPDHFACALKFIYTHVFDVQIIKFSTDKDENLEKALFILGVQTVANKYDIQRLLPSTINSLEKVLKLKVDVAMLESIIKKHYGVCSAPGSAIGEVIARTTICNFHSFVAMEGFAVLLNKYAIFASDIAQYYHKQGMFNVRRHKCECCASELLHHNPGYQQGNVVEFTCHDCDGRVFASDTWCE